MRVAKEFKVSLDRRAFKDLQVTFKAYKAYKVSVELVIKAYKVSKALQVTFREFKAYRAVLVLVVRESKVE